MPTVRGTQQSVVENYACMGPNADLYSNAEGVP